MAPVIEFLALFGLALSLYTLWVQHNMRRPGWKAPCDFGKRISCTRSFKSEYGRLLFVHNGWLGVGFYLAVILASISGFRAIVLGLAIVAVLFSVLLAYLGYVRMKNFCVVCTAVYAVNILLLVFALL